MIHMSLDENEMLIDCYVFHDGSIAIESEMMDELGDEPFDVGTYAYIMGIADSSQYSQYKKHTLKVPEDCEYVLEYCEELLLSRGLL